MDERQRFQEVVLPHLDDALSFARWLTGSVTDAEDVVQDACIRAYGAIGGVRDSNPRAWLLAIVRNTAFTWLAKNRPKALLVTDDESLFEQAGFEMNGSIGHTTPETMLIAKSDGEHMLRAIAALPLAFREVLVLRELEEMSYKEIANLLSLPVGTVMSRLARARALLIQATAVGGVGKAGAT